MKSYGVTIQMKTSSTVLLHGTVCFSVFYKMKFGIFLEFFFGGTLGSYKELKTKTRIDTYSPSFPQIATAALRSTSEPSNRIESQTRKTVSSGRHVANSVRNHCMVNTLIRGGSYMALEPFWDKACCCKLSRCLESRSSLARIRSRSTAMSTDSARKLLAK